MTSGMTYEKVPIRRVIKRKAVAKYTTDMSKLSTLRILSYLYKRHQVIILELLVVITWTWLLVTNIT